jgi:hypothetical protein
MTLDSGLLTTNPDSTTHLQPPRKHEDPLVSQT